MSTSEHAQEQGIQPASRRIGYTHPAIWGAVAFVVAVAAVAAVWVLWPDGGSAEPVEDGLTWSIASGTSVEVVPATVIRVLDGDTAVYRFEDGTTEKVRMIGIDAPEMVAVSDKYTQGCTNHARQLLEESPKVYLEKGVKERDKFGQLLAYVWLSEPSGRPSPEEVRARMLNARMLLDGYAKEFPVEPGVDYENIRYTALLQEFAGEARKSGAGFWDPSTASGAGSPGLW